jgi:Cu-Zn family superoxide dismutase
VKLQNIVAMVGLLTLPVSGFAQKEKPVKVELHDAQGKSVGTATLSPAAKGVNIDLDLKGMTPGEHGMHIHQTAKCEGPGFTTAGGHLNPDSKQHGLDNPQGPHAGDMPNFTVKADGTAKTKVVAPGITMGTDSHSIFSNGGTALIIHAKQDDEKTDPSGNSGDRVVCGTIAKQ